MSDDPKVIFSTGNDLQCLDGNFYWRYNLYCQWHGFGSLKGWFGACEGAVIVDDCLRNALVSIAINESASMGKVLVLWMVNRLKGSKG